MRAMILAAGRGARMGELTQELPKPLLAVGGKPLITHHLQALAAVGITDVVINLHYLGQHLKDVLGDGADYGVNITYSIETVLLNTGGAIYQALPLLGETTFAVLNADVWTDYPFERFLSVKTRGAHIVLVDNPAHHLVGDFSFDSGKFQVDHAQRYTYSGLGVYHPAFFSGYSGGIFPLGSCLRQGIDDATVTGEHYAGCWVDVGTPERLAHVNACIKG